ncbi:mycofactocin biosynthesis glycosyltransferase MftF [Geobacter sp.]|uniref:mycofactocin biosynthesis glycosyltransferase MftF n=1 Tax=Geobacter sp. TaxID=46610 RepID=UPI002605AB99|nr:mycofactocin biosynthesis glycosyltransferase MftF [Geobacter sp.]
MNYRLAQHVELVERGGEQFLVAKAPLCVVRLNASLMKLVRRAREVAISPVTPAEAAVLEQLAAKGFMERLRSGEEQKELPAVSIVIPVKDRAEELGRCLASLDGLTYPRELLQVIVVDDGSSDGSAAVARGYGAQVVPSGGTGRGPAAARNVGASAARGDILAFIDSDCTASKEWLAELVPAFAEPRTAAVGGLVDGMCTESAVDRYEAVMSSLSLGSRERSGSGGDDTFYLPSCNLLVRRSAFRSADGFDDAMHVGEDVDLTWRLRDEGWTIAYLPAGRVYHEHRSTLRSFMSRRFDYGTSEGMLQILHPHRRKRMVIPPLLALLLALCALAPFTGWWTLPAAAGILVADATAVRFRLARRNLPMGLGALLCGRLRALGSLVYYLCYHLVRYYSIPLVAVALLVPHFWLLPLGALLCAAKVDHAVKKPQLSFAPFALIYFLEQVAYGAGAFWGCLSRRCFASYRVVILRQMEVAG